MVLEYKFEYTSNNNFYESYIKNILDDTKLEYSIKKENEDIFLYIKDEEAKLLEFSQELSTKLPMSIFLKKFTVNVLSDLPKTAPIKNTIDRKLSYCNNCYEETKNINSKNYFNPFINCKICGESHNTNELLFSQKDKILEFENYEELFSNLALMIFEDKKVKIKTSRGSYIFSKNIDLDKNNNLLCCNIENIYKLAAGEKEKIILLQSIEKPSLEFDVNAVYKTNNPVTKDKVTVVYPYDLLLKLICDELIKLGIDFLSIEKNSKEYDAKLTYINLDKELSTPKITNCLDKIFVLENGIYDKKYDDIKSTFDEQAKSQLMILKDENKLHDKTILNIFTSSKYEDNICIYSKEVDGIIDILNYKLPKSVKELYKSIEKEKGGKNLIENYKAKFPNEYLDGFMFDINSLKTNSIFSLWKLASVILGLDDIFKNATSQEALKGPRIDYKTIQHSENSSLREFDFIKLIKSGMSFKLAGIDDNVLSMGYFESYIDFISNFVDELNTKFDIDGVSFSGDLITNELFYKKVLKNFSKNYTLYFNKDFPVQ